jgi:hypothetical protein
LLGAVRSPVAFAPGSTLRVKFFLPAASPQEPALDPTKVVIEAREIVPTRNYFMRSKAAPWQAGAWNDFGPWPTVDVLDSQGIQATNLAVLASYSLKDGSRVYLPVEVLAGVPPSTASTYTFQFTTSYEIHSLETTLTSPSGKVEVLPAIQCSAGPTCIVYEADSPHAFTIDMKDRPQGIYRLHLHGHVPNSKFQPELSIQIYHKGS